jgi:hypothetical protein
MHAAIVFGGGVALVVFWVLFGSLLAPKGETASTVPSARPATA